MAFVFTVEDGSGVTGANSYVSLAEADDIISIDFRLSPTWEAIVDDDKELLLALATRYLDENYQWYGVKTDREQALAWPRKFMKDGDGYCIADAVIPIEVRKATAYLAVWLKQNDGDEVMNMENVKRFRSDEIEIEWQDGYEGRKAPEFLSKLLTIFGTGPNDRGFKRIVRV